MKSEFAANQALSIEVEIEKVKNEIRNYVGIVPASLYDKLDSLESKK